MLSYMYLNKDLASGRDKSHKRVMWLRQDAPKFKLYRGNSALLYSTPHKLIARKMVVLELCISEQEGDI